MSQRFSAAAAKVRRFLGSRLFWRIILGLFLFEALWFVCSAKYPMAFDENYHFGLIQLHAHQWMPYFTAQPVGAGSYGAIVRDPSYLYHWLMSFPYRFFSLFTHDQTDLVISLRLINVALFTLGLVLSRKIIRRIGVSNALTNSLLLAFILIPVVPFLAATINYDNLFFVSVAVTILLAIRIQKGLEHKKVDALALFWLVITALFSSLVKYPYLPVFVVVVVFLLIQFARYNLMSRTGGQSFVRSLKTLSWLKRIGLILLCLVALGLFAERYVDNAVKYHGPVPKCDAVISQDECAQYGPYNRDLFFKHNKPASFHPNVLVYSWEWMWGMWYRLYFAISDTYATAPPLLVLAWLGVICAVLMLVGILLRFRQLFSNQPGRQLILWIILIYTLVLFADGFGSYKKTGQPVAINGRYLVPFLPFIFAFGGLAWSQLLKRRPNIKVAAATIILGVMLLQGGGTMTFIIRSSDTWMWPDPTVRRINHDVRSIAWPFILGRGNY